MGIRRQDIEAGTRYCPECIQNVQEKPEKKENKSEAPSRLGCSRAGFQIIPHLLRRPWKYEWENVLGGVLQRDFGACRETMDSSGAKWID